MKKNDCFKKIMIIFGCLWIVCGCTNHEQKQSLEPVDNNQIVESDLKTYTHYFSDSYSDKLQLSIDYYVKQDDDGTSYISEVKDVYFSSDDVDISIDTSHPSFYGIKDEENEKYITSLNVTIPYKINGTRIEYQYRFALSNEIGLVK